MKILDEYPASELLSARGIPFAEMEIVTSLEDSLLAAGRIGYPVVMKLSSEVLTHKTEVEGVKIGIENDRTCKNAWKDLMTNAEKAGMSFSGSLRGILVQKMIPKGTEFIIGGKRDALFGPVVMFGIGGIYTELFKEMSFRLAPFDLKEAEKMVRSTKASNLIDGYRGASELNSIVLYNTLVSVSKILVERTDITELDINPFVLGSETGLALDALIRLS
jgi:acetate---CoA ligase (ADP-forming)